MSLKKAVILAQEALKQEDADTAYNSLSEVLVGLSKVFQRQHLFNVPESTSLVLDDYYSRMFDLGETFLSYGWPTLDEMTGGIRDGDFTTIVGRPAAGKTYMLLNCAMNNWRVHHHPILFVSMEMSALSIMQRLAAMYTAKPVKGIIKGALSTKVFNAFTVGLEEMSQEQVPFWLVDGNLTTTVEDIRYLCQQVKPRAVFVDGTYLLRHPNVRMPKWDRIMENAESLKKDVATSLGIPTICSYQLGREAAKKKKSDKHGVEDIYGSDAIGQLSTVVLGLFEHESVGTLLRRKVDVLKGRNGEVGSFVTRWNFNQMDFSEWIEPNTEDLQFIE
jgi:replicative DNA helicase